MIWAPVLLIALALLFGAFLTFDRIVKTEYRIDRAAWEADGRHGGFSWKAPECTYFQSGWAMNRLAFVWLELISKFE
jgi:hypothetical protein